MAQDVWNLLAKCYSTTDIIHQYQLYEKLHTMRQLSGQLVNDFLSQMQAIWDQLALAEPAWENAKDAENYYKYCDNLRVLHFPVVLTHEYEPVRATILHRGSVPTLEGVVSKLLSEETRLSILKSQLVNTSIDTNSVLAVAPKIQNLTRLAIVVDDLGILYQNVESYSIRTLRMQDLI